LAILSVNQAKKLGYITTTEDTPLFWTYKTLTN